MLRKSIKNQRSLTKLLFADKLFNLLNIHEYKFRGKLSQKLKQLYLNLDLTIPTVL